MLLLPKQETEDSELQANQCLVMCSQNHQGTQSSIQQLMSMSQFIMPLIRTVHNLLVSFCQSLAPELVSTARQGKKDEFRALLLRWGYMNLTLHQVVGTATVSNFLRKKREQASWQLLRTTGSRKRANWSRQAKGLGGAWRETVGMGRRTVSEVGGNCIPELWLM